MRSLHSILGGVMIFAGCCNASSIFDRDPYEIRDMINQKCFELEAETPQVFKVEEKIVERKERTTPIRIYYPGAEGNYPLVLMIHGGAWVGGTLDTHDHMARFVCKHAEAVVVSVGYQNAPEGKYPAVLEQSFDSLLWACEQGEAIQVNPAHIAVMGDSAGGNMSAALCLLARDRKGPKIGFQVLVNPVTDLSGKGTLEPQGDDLDVIRWNAAMYVADPRDASLPYVSPALAEDLTGLPPALILAGEHDELRPDNERFADLLRKAGVPVNLYYHWGIAHLAWDGARVSKRGEESFEVAAAALRGFFYRNSQPKDS